jgi:hypothetical protein
VSGFVFFTAHQARTIAAAAERMFPADELGPGATDAGVVYYVDRALAGHDARLRDTYCRGIALLDTLARERGAPSFVEASPALQDAVLAAAEDAEPPLPGPMGFLFFESLLSHVKEGLFADPIHGGNRGMVGWRLLGFPGIHLVHPPEAFAPDARVDWPTRSLADLDRP